MNKVDFQAISWLSLLAIFIWLRDTSWMSAPEDTFPILAAIPAFIWLGWPWKFSRTPPHLPVYKIVITTLLCLAGIALNFTLLLAIGWTILLWTWLSARISPESIPATKKLLILPLMAFPWVSLDANQIGWWFRLSGAQTTGYFFSLLGLNVKQQGTQLLINQLPISVEEACAGLNTLQSMLIAGSCIAYILLGNSSRYWWNLPIIVFIAWLANTLRIITISFAGLLVSPKFAMGAFHTWGGWLVIILMFLLCWTIFSLQEPKHSNTE